MKMILTTAAMILSANLYATTSYDDLNGVIDSGHDFYTGSSQSASLPTAVQPGIGDQYGDSFLHSGGVVDSRQTMQPGFGDGYASSLIDQNASLNW